MTRNLPRSYNTICFYRFLWWSLWTQAGLLARIIQLSAARTVDRSLYTASLLSHTRVVDRPQLCCHLTLGGGRVLPTLASTLGGGRAMSEWGSDG